MLKFKNSFS